eukprot:scaffold11172_cov172-Amphora_coffeaeformis.AAC.5
MTVERCAPLVYVGGIVLNWWLQPWALYYLLNLWQDDNSTVNSSGSSSEKKNAKERKCRLATASYLCVAMAVTAALGHELHASLQARSIFVKPMLFIVLWYTTAMQFLRYLHLLSVGPTVFRGHFGLTSLRRTQLFMWSAPTIQFLPSNKKGDDAASLSVSPLLTIHHSASSDLSWSHFKSEFRMALWDVVGMEVLCATVLLFHLGEKLPLVLQALIRVYIMGFSTAVLKILLECPSYYYILRCTAAKMDDTSSTMIRAFPIYNRPHRTQSPRELWHRWSVTAGYHLRLAYYEPVMQRFRRHHQDSTTNTTTTTHRPTTTMMERLVATAAPFVVNCLLHVTWWSIVIKGELDYIYWKLLFVYPMASFFIQDILVRLMAKGQQQQEHTKNPSKTTATNDDSSTTSTSTLKPSALPSPPSWQHSFLNILLMWIGFILIGEPMSLAHGLHSKLTDVARANLLMRPLSESSC